MPFPIRNWRSGNLTLLAKKCNSGCPVKNGFRILRYIQTISQPKAPCTKFRCRNLTSVDFNDAPTITMKINQNCKPLVRGSTAFGAHVAPHTVWHLPRTVCSTTPCSFPRFPLAHPKLVLIIPLPPPSSSKIVSWSSRASEAATGSECDGAKRGQEVHSFY